MISKKMEQSLNQQINSELYSSYLYLAMAAYFDGENWRGFANWMKVQSQEELTHAMKIYGFVNERSGRITLDAIAEPPAKWKSPLEAFQAAYKHEQLVTSRIHTLVELSTKEKDHATGVFLHWFVAEQVEEEASVDVIVRNLELTKDAVCAIAMIEQQLSQRKFSPPQGD
jgi:ferritin